MASCHSVILQNNVKLGESLDIKMQSFTEWF